MTRQGELKPVYTVLPCLRCHVTTSLRVADFLLSLFGRRIMSAIMQGPCREGITEGLTSGTSIMTSRYDPPCLGTSIIPVDKCPILLPTTWQKAQIRFNPLGQELDSLPCQVTEYVSLLQPHSRNPATTLDWCRIVLWIRGALFLFLSFLFFF